MVPIQIANAVMEMAPEDRLELARRLIESVVAPSPISCVVEEGIRRIEDVAAGRVTGLSEEEFLRALG